jgi:DNA-binding MarR family transcriptional regulator
MPDDTPSAVDYAALSDFRHALRRFLVFSEQKAAECGLAPQQHQALLAIQGAPTPRVTVGYLAERLVIKPHTASELVDRLEAAGLVVRVPSQSDRRQALIEPTPAALEVLERLSATHRQELLRLRPMFTALLTRLE